MSHSLLHASVFTVEDTWRPNRLGETSAFTSSGAEPLELLVVAVARDMETKTVVMRGVARP